jgi:hypothetical protein
MTENAYFVGRESALAQIHQHFTRTQHTQALTIVGRARIGKTALLQQVDAIVDPMVAWVLFVPLREAPLDSEETWLRYLFGLALDAAVGHGFSRERLPAPPDSVPDFRAWLQQTGFPEFFHVIRGARRVLYLLDNSGALIDAIQRGRLPADHGAYLHGLLQPQLDMIITISEANETRLSALVPLVNPAETVRLKRLTRIEIKALASLIAGEPVANDAAAALYTASGGQPDLAQRIARTHRPGAVSTSSIKAAAATVYTESGDFFRQEWDTLTANEQIVLTAIARILYDDPLARISADQITDWLHDTDDPLDQTAVNAALRGLDYAEIIEHSTNGFVPRSGLMQRWLMENARLAPRKAAAPPSREQSRALWAVIALGGLILLALLAALILGGLPAPVVDATIAPTVTLASP